MIKKVLKILAILFGELVIVYYKDIFILKSKIKAIKNLYLKCFLTSVYERKLYHLGSYIGVDAKLGRNIVFPHGVLGIFISNAAEIGDNAVIYQHVTIGSNTMPGHKRNGSPKIGKNCYIGVGAKIIGNIIIGDNCRIGANCVVYQDIPDNSVVVLPEPRIIQKENLDNRYYIVKDGIYYYQENGEYKEYKE
jgi:serine O-acetyltransferase